MAGLAYRRILAEQPSEHLPGWRTLPLESGLHDPPTGFDAACFVHSERQCIVAAFRGTGEGRNSSSWLSWLADLMTDGLFLALPEWIGDKVEEGLANRDFRELVNQARTGFPSRSRSAAIADLGQFRLAAALASTLLLHYPDWRLILTGFSLGGALAAYAAAIHGLEAITFAAPSCYWLLPAEFDGGLPDSSGVTLAGIRNFTHPCDCVGAGPFEEYPHKVGLTFYLGDGYAEANRCYTGHPWRRIYDSLFGEPLYHSLEHFRFTPEGRPANRLVRSQP